MSIQKNPRVGVATIILKEEYSDVPIILLGLRISEKNHGHNDWCLPGGKLKWREEPNVCAARETKEECGLDIELAPNIIAVTNDYWPEADEHFVTLYYVAKRLDDTAEPVVSEPEKCVRWQWFKTTELPQNLMKGTLTALLAFELISPNIIQQQETPIY